MAVKNKPDTRQNKSKTTKSRVKEGAQTGSGKRAISAKQNAVGKKDAQKKPDGRIKAKTSAKKAPQKKHWFSKKTQSSTKAAPKKHTDGFFDYSLLFIVVFLVCFGLVMIYSASSYNAQIEYSDSFHYLKRQAASAAMGVVLLLAISKIPYQLWKRYIIWAYIAINLLLAVVLVAGTASHGQKRWIYIGSFGFQPSEIAKMFLIIFLAYICSEYFKELKHAKGILLTFATAMPAVIFVAVTNLSTGIILLGLTFIIIFVASNQYKIFAAVILAGSCLMGLFLRFASYRMDRVQAWLNVETDDNAYQTRQALYAIGSGGVFGKGLGRSIQKLSYVPESHNDMIFSIICEELGLFGAISIILLFVLLLWRCMVIANNAPDLFGALLVIGVMSQIGLQVIINIAVVTNSMPNTGVTLPFISYGGTSLTFLLCEIGLVLSVSRGIKFEK